MLLDDEDITAQREHSFFGDVINYFDSAAKFTKYPEGLLDQIKFCNSVYRMKFPVRMEDRIEVVVAYRWLWLASLIVQQIRRCYRTLVLCECLT